MTQDIQNAMEKSLIEIRDGLLQDEINKSISIREEAHASFERMCSENVSISEIKEESKLMLSKLMIFESNIIHFEILNFLYTTIARTALNSIDFPTCMAYAQAGIELNKKEDDIEGITSNAMVIVDLACVLGAFESVSLLYDLYPEAEQDDIAEFVKNTPSKNDELFEKLFNSSQRPNSLGICLDNNKKAEERAIRIVMSQMGISRKEALKYKKTAEEMSAKGFI